MLGYTQEIWYLNNGKHMRNERESKWAERKPQSAIMQYKGSFVEFYGDVND